MLQCNALGGRMSNHERAFTKSYVRQTIVLCGRPTVRERRPCTVCSAAGQATRCDGLSYRGATYASMFSLVNRGIIWSRLATCHTAAAISADAFFTSSGIIRSYVSRFV